jgi:RNA polymerase sigma factor (sigma-70 family)
VVTGVCMATAKLHDFLRRLARGMDAELLGQESDRHLVERALGQRDAAALQAIVHRHGAMVYRVCLRVLQHTQDTEDAFQATFLVLAQRLRTVRKHASLASWLHGVAYRVSVKTKIQAAARHRHESRASLSDTMPPEDVTLKEAISVLDAELSRLPDKWRLPLVLCYLEGRTQDEAAKRLMWSKSTLRSRLQEARDVLARRLTARGITLPAALSAVLLSECVASAMPAPGLVARAVEAAADIAAGKTLATAASVEVAALAEGVLKTMFRSKLKPVIGIALVLSFIVTGATLLSRTTAAGSDQPPAAEAPAKPPPKPEQKPEQKPEKPEKEPFTAWGKEVGGLQAGLGFRPGEQRAYALGETVTLVVRIRNVGKEKVKFEYLEQYLDEEPPVVTDADGKTLPQHRSPLLGEHFPVRVSLEPGQQIELKSHMDGALAVRHHLMSVKPSEQKPAERRQGRRLSVETGKVRIHYDRVLGDSSSGKINLDPALSKVGTGKLELEIKSDPPPAEKGVKPTPNGNKPVHSLVGHQDRVIAVAYSPDGRWIATAAWDGTARLWDARTGKEVRRLDLPAPQGFTAHLTQILFSPDNELVVVARQAPPNEPSVIVWNRRTGEKVREFPGGGDGSVAISPDGRLIACGGWGRDAQVNNPGVVRLFELATGKPVRELHGHQSRIDLLAFSPDGETVIAHVGIPRPPLPGGQARLGFDPSGVRAWEVATGKEKERRATLNALWKGNQYATSPDGRTQAAGASLCETATGGLRAKLTGDTNDGRAVAFAPDGRTLASGSTDATVRLWDLPSGKELARFGEEEVPKGDGVLAVAFSPDDKSLVSGGLDKTAHIWDVSKITGRQRAVAERTQKELEADWKDLGGDAATAYVALGRLVSSPKSAVPFLEKSLEASVPVDLKLVERLIADLDDEDFKVREQATKELGAMGDRVAPALRKALANDPSPEASQRLRGLLGRIDGSGPSAETAREIRAVEALEAIGTAEARRLLDRLAAGPAGARLTEESKASADRLTKRSAVRS